MRLYCPDQAPIHGGRLNAVIDKYDIPANSWLDLSTGINPNGWPVPNIPATIFNRLPEDDDNLTKAAIAYYKTDSLLPIAGSQAAIQLLPKLRKSCTVGVVYPGYQEHAFRWHMAGHRVYLLNESEIESSIEKLDVLVLINPNNPTGKSYSTDQLLVWHRRLQSTNGWLIVDEAFMDTETDNSLLPFCNTDGIIVLRSLGKFFGLAGLRVGFVFGKDTLLEKLALGLGPWTISHPSRYIAALALQDFSWQVKAHHSLSQTSESLHGLLVKYGLLPKGGTKLFQWVKHDDAFSIYRKLMKQGILVRHFSDSSSLRFGIPRSKPEFSRLENALQTIQTNLWEASNA